jgi:hypothetical protein
MSDSEEFYEFAALKLTKSTCSEVIAISSCHDLHVCTCSLYSGTMKKATGNITAAKYSGPPTFIRN